MKLRFFAPVLALALTACQFDFSTVETNVPPVPGGVDVEVTFGEGFEDPNSLTWVDITVKAHHPNSEYDKAYGTNRTAQTTAIAQSFSGVPPVDALVTVKGAKGNVMSGNLTPVVEATRSVKVTSSATASLTIVLTKPAP